METSIIQNRTTNNVVDLAVSIIYSKIYVIRGCRVMLDFDLAERYEVETRRLKEQVRRNIERFPSDFMFQLSKDEWRELIANCDNLPVNIKHSPVTPLAFTQEGIGMLSGVLHSEKAINANIDIMRAFVAMRNYALSYEGLKLVLEAYMDKTDRKLDDICEVLDALMSVKEEEDKPRNPIGFKQKNTDN